MAQERRIVTVLFADVVGSTGLAAEEDPEEVRALMARYYDIARAVVAEHGGTIEKFIGDAVMAVFGLPRAHGDDAARALAAAVALRDRVAGDAALGRLELRFGLATGEVVGSRDTAGGEFLVTGDAVNVAARLQQGAAPGEIVATDRTAWDARAQFEFGASSRVDIKSRREPVLARSLLGPTRPHRLRSVTPFVGRADELEQLALTARRTFRDRVPGVVSIVAPAGTGKSRLVEEFLSARLPSLAGNARIETAQCLPYGAQLTYWPLRSVLYSLVGIGPDAPAGSILEAAKGWLGDTRDAELLAATVGAESAASADPTEVFTAWRTALARAAAERPLVIVFEDLHWSSDSLLDLVEFVMAPRESVPVLILAIARPELIDRRPAWGGGQRNFISVYLDPLPEADIAALVGPVLEGAANDLLAQVVRRSEGNPFFAGELAQAALERGADALPDTVHATVMARLDLLDDEERRLLQVASVFGRTFRPEALGAIAPDLDARLSALADALMSRDLIRRNDAEHLAFRHILIRDVAYSTLPRSEKSQLHAAAGEWFEGRAAGREDEVAEIVALHFREAVSNTAPHSPALGELRRKAAKWLLRGADAAVNAAATREAEGHLRAALQMIDDQEMAAETWARLGEVLRVLPGGFEAYQNAVRLAREPERRLAVLGGLLVSAMRYVRVEFEEEQVEAAIAEGARLVSALHDPSLEARFLAGVGFQANWALQRGVTLSDSALQRARESATRAVALAETLDEPNLVSTTLDALDSTAMYVDDWNAVLVNAQRRRAYGARLSLAEIMDADHMATWAYVILGKPQAAGEVNAESAARLRAGQAPEWRLSTLSWRLRINYTLGRWSEAMGIADEALALWRQLGSPGLGWVRVGFRPGIMMARGRRDAAREQAMTSAVRASRGTLSSAAYDLAVVEDDLDGIGRSMPALVGAGFGPMMIADGLRQLADAGLDGTGIVQELPERYRRLPILKPQVLRVVGLASQDANQLREALDLARGHSDAPTVARLAVELGRRTRDPGLVEEGHTALAAMGDVTQLERFGLG